MRTLIWKIVEFFFGLPPPQPTAAAAQTRDDSQNEDWVVEAKEKTHSRHSPRLSTHSSPVIVAHSMPVAGAASEGRSARLARSQVKRTGSSTAFSYVTPKWAFSASRNELYQVAERVEANPSFTPGRDECLNVIYEELQRRELRKRAKATGRDTRPYDFGSRSRHIDRTRAQYLDYSPTKQLAAPNHEPVELIPPSKGVSVDRSLDHEPHCLICAAGLAVSRSHLCQCINCLTVYHRECWLYNTSVCAIYGCQSMEMTYDIRDPAADSQGIN